MKFEYQILFLQWHVYSSMMGFVNSFVTITNSSQNFEEYNCDSYYGSKKLLTFPKHLKLTADYYKTFNINSQFKSSDEDPMKIVQRQMQLFLFGESNDDNNYDGTIHISKLAHSVDDKDYDADPLAQYPSGNIMRAELFDNRSSVHLPISDFMHPGHLHLKLTKDYMQTAVNAFSIFLHGNLDDILRLPATYVLRSARTIAMMKLGREKLAATWTVVKGDRQPEMISYQTLEMYRPLFKYLNGREIARLNLRDDKILTYIGTHADLNRHQVGVVASKYIQLNKDWMQPKHLNLMNNLLCGVPMSFMRSIPRSTYLQLSHQVFYHIRACDPLQRRFYLAMMTRTQVLGKSYSWSARDVYRLGLLLAEVEGPDLSAINPEAMSGITAQVMLEMPVQSLKYITDMQLRYIGQKPLNILAKKLKVFQDEQPINFGRIIVYYHNKETLIVVVSISFFKFYK